MAVMKRIWYGPPNMQIYVSPPQSGVKSTETLERIQSKAEEAANLKTNSPIAIIVKGKIETTHDIDNALNKNDQLQEQLLLNRLLSEQSNS
jgi:hypothetical protein